MNNFDFWQTKTYLQFSVAILFECTAKPDIHIKKQRIKKKALDLLIGSSHVFNYLSD